MEIKLNLYEIRAENEIKVQYKYYGFACKRRSEA